jgi:hypothetical protein
MPLQPANTQGESSNPNPIDDKCLPRLATDVASLGFLICNTINIIETYITERQNYSKKFVTKMEMITD